MQIRSGRQTGGMHLRHIRVLVKYGVENNWVAGFSFKGVATSSVATADHLRQFVDSDKANKIMAHCPDSESRAVFALMRFSGLRCPTETHKLMWTDVDFESNYMNVPDKKRHCRRLVPIVPELRVVLVDHMAECKHLGVELGKVVSSSPNNLPRQLQKIL